MKKKIIVAIAVLAIIVLGIAIWFYGYNNQKNMDNIPSKEITVTYLQEKGEQYATEKLMGYSRASLIEIWGEPDVMFSGLWGDGWEVDTVAGIVVFYDSDNKVESVKFRSAFEATILEIHNSYYLVEPAEGSQERKASERIEVPMQSLDPSLEPEVGDTIEIMHSGVIMEINPPRLREVYSIKVVHEAKKEDSNNETENKVEATTEAEVIETAVVYPLPTTIDLDNIEDCTLAVSIENGNIYSNEAGTATLKMRVTVYDYELYDMVDISQLEVGNILEINKAQPEFVYIDASDPDGGEKKYTVADFTINDVFLDYNGTPHNTSVVVENGIVTSMTKVYTP